MRKFTIVLSSVVVLVGVTVFLAATARSDSAAGGDKGPDALKSLCEDIVLKMSRGEAKGWAMLLENMASRPSPSADQAAEGVLQIKASLALQERYGKFLGCELARVRKLGETVRKFLYLAKYEKGAVVWTFTLYRPHDKRLLLAGTWADAVTAPGSLFD